MTQSHPTQTVRGAEPRGVWTNGEGKPTTAHLNLTKTIADVRAEEVRVLLARRAARAPVTDRPRAFVQYAKIGYAGREERL